MSARMIKLYMTTFFEKFKMKYITHEMINEDIFPIFGEEPLPYKRVDNIDEIMERLG